MATVSWFLGAVVAAAVVLVARFIFILIRDQEGIGMGDVKLMAMLGGWFGMKRSLLAFAIGVVTCAIFCAADAQSAVRPCRSKGMGKDEAAVRNIYLHGRGRECILGSAHHVGILAINCLPA